ncbi:GNAT family N-acetyltransferase [Photobacterium sp. TY1-4]|uniref:GNAT family N-acetyltransferase n=1 Tax=Photobacterium sp. TY1-4 TaxID=2899122 RepID=UPI0021BE80E1|nr:GNAT family N-acetyltransferase [Photobacterium sp. TY1-4]UXI03461.1 GNAT family N-acetyltransferase [Photobacterium sp. TY1-4]
MDTTHKEIIVLSTLLNHHRSPRLDCEHIPITDAITLRHLALGHAEGLLDAVERSRPQLATFLGWVEQVINVSGARQYIRDRIDAPSPGARWYAIFHQQTFCGVFGIKSIAPRSHIAEVGYWLSSEVQGKRVIPQVLTALIPALAQETNADIVEFRCLEHNQASIRVATRAGAKWIKSVDHQMDVHDAAQKLNIYHLALKPWKI